MTQFLKISRHSPNFSKGVLVIILCLILIVVVLGGWVWRSESDIYPGAAVYSHSRLKMSQFPRYFSLSDSTNFVVVSDKIEMTDLEEWYADRYGAPKTTPRFDAFGETLVGYYDRGSFDLGFIGFTQSVELWRTHETDEPYIRRHRVIYFDAPWENGRENYFDQLNVDCGLGRTSGFKCLYVSFPAQYELSEEIVDERIDPYSN